MGKESKKERFKRVAEKRVQNIIQSVRSLSGLSNKKVYEWDTAQLERIWGAIEREIENCREHFKDPESQVFRL